MKKQLLLFSLSATVLAFTACGNGGEEAGDENVYEETENLGEVEDDADNMNANAEIEAIEANWAQQVEQERARVEERYQRAREQAETMKAEIDQMPQGQARQQAQERYDVAIVALEDWYNEQNERFDEINLDEVNESKWEEFTTNVEEGWDGLIQDMEMIDNKQDGDMKPALISDPE